MEKTWLYDPKTDFIYNTDTKNILNRTAVSEEELFQEPDEEELDIIDLLIAEGY